MSETTVRFWTHEELLERRAEVLRETGMDEPRLRRLAAEWCLDLDTSALLDEIDRLDFLLGRR